MIRFVHPAAWLVAFSLAACAAPKKYDAWNPYALGAPNVPVDNDSYYRQPGSYSCGTIADSPSCGGAD